MSPRPAGGQTHYLQQESRDHYPSFATPSGPAWRAFLRGRIDVGTVATEIACLRRLSSGAEREGDDLKALPPPDMLGGIDPFDRIQLAHVIATCRASHSLSEASASFPPPHTRNPPTSMTRTGYANI
jgi:sigma54-dependent transcription regulator